ncbi:MAG: HAD family hydrolase [Pseudomonadota bacterium]
MGLQDIAVFVFDLDDTLYPEKQFVESGLHAVSAYLQASGMTAADLFPQLWQKFSGGRQGTIFNEALSDAGIAYDAGIINKLVQVYRSHTPEIHLYPDALFLLQHLQGRKKIGLLSDGYAETQKNKVTALGAEVYFDSIVFTDALGREFWKPHPAGFNKIMGRFSAAGHECLYVGDNPEKDFYGARKLGWKTIQVKRTDGIYNGRESLSDEHRADSMVQSLYEIAVRIE